MARGIFLSEDDDLKSANSHSGRYTHHLHTSDMRSYGHETQHLQPQAATKIMNVIGEKMLTEFLNVRISVTDKVSV